MLLYWLQIIQEGHVSRFLVLYKFYVPLYGATWISTWSSEEALHFTRCNLFSFVVQCAGIISREYAITMRIIVLFVVSTLSLIYGTFFDSVRIRIDWCKITQAVKAVVILPFVTDRNESQRGEFLDVSRFSKLQIWFEFYEDRYILQH